MRIAAELADSSLCMSVDVLLFVCVSPLSVSRDPSSIYTSVVSRGEHLRFPSSNEIALPPAFSVLVASCWQADAAERPTFTQIVQQLQKLQKQPQSQIY